MISGDTGSETPSPEQVIELLVKGLRSSVEENQYRVTALCYDATMTIPNSGVKSDAICVEFEDKDDKPIKVFVPYRKSLVGSVKLGEVVATQGDGRIFRNKA
jgi:hypothetical protein